jgi:hypothetical protein
LRLFCRKSFRNRQHRKDSFMRVAARYNRRAV